MTADVFEVETCQATEAARMRKDEDVFGIGELVGLVVMGLGGSPIQKAVLLSFGKFLAGFVGQTMNFCNFAFDEDGGNDLSFLLLRIYEYCRQSSICQLINLLFLIPKVISNSRYFKILEQ